jgi:hypothetical protein
MATGFGADIDDVCTDVDRLVLVVGEARLVVCREFEDDVVDAVLGVGSALWTNVLSPDGDGVTGLPVAWLIIPLSPGSTLTGLGMIIPFDDVLCRIISSKGICYLRGLKSSHAYVSR